MISSTTESIGIEELIKKLLTAKENARANGQLEKVRITMHHAEIRIVTVPAYSELNPDFVAAIPLA